MAFGDLLPWMSSAFSSLFSYAASSLPGFFGYLLNFLLLGLPVAFLCHWWRSLLTIQRPQKIVMWGLVAIPQGEHWNIQTASGELRTVVGPKVVRVLGATLIQLPPFSATHAEYLLVNFVDGRTAIVPGPVVVYMDRAVHKDIKVRPATNLTDHEVLVAYREDDDGEGERLGEAAAERKKRAVRRYVIEGPCLHVPRNSTEWIHEFRWHGSTARPVPRGRSDSSDSGVDVTVNRKYKDSMIFQKLRTCPDQTYFDVEGVRTRDDALITVKLMIFFRLKDIDIMLKETHDPIADFVNAVSSDVIEFVAGKSFEEFKGASEELNELRVYQQLTSRAARIGYDVTKVVFRGYGAPQRLQKMHDDAIERRTKLVLERETEEQEQKLEDMRLGREEARNQKKRQMEADSKAHERELQRAEHEANERERLDQRQAQLEHLSNLKRNLGLSEASLAGYLVAMEQGPPEKLVQIVGKEAGGSSFVHLQETA